MMDGILFDSQAEAMYYLYLKDLRDKGTIYGLELQQKFPILPRFPYVDPMKRGQKRYKKSTIGVTYYIPDFTFTVRHAFTLAAGVLNIPLEDNEEVVIDVKGMKTPIYRLKRKMFLHQYPDLVFIES